MQAVKQSKKFSLMASTKKKNTRPVNQPLLEGDYEIKTVSLRDLHGNHAAAAAT